MLLLKEQQVYGRKAPSLVSLDVANREHTSRVYSKSLAQLRSSLLCLTLQTQSVTARVRSQSPSRRPPINQSTAGSVSWLPSIFAALAGVQATDFLAATGSESLCPCLEGNSMKLVNLASITGQRTGGSSERSKRSGASPTTPGLQLVMCAQLCACLEAQRLLMLSRAT